MKLVDDTTRAAKHAYAADLLSQLLAELEALTLPEAT